MDRWMFRCQSIDLFSTRCPCMWTASLGVLSILCAGTCLGQNQHATYESQLAQFSDSDTSNHVNMNGKRTSFAFWPNKGLSLLLLTEWQLTSKQGWARHKNSCLSLAVVSCLHWWCPIWGSRCTPLLSPTPPSVQGLVSRRYGDVLIRDFLPFLLVAHGGPICSDFLCPERGVASDPGRNPPSLCCSCRNPPDL